MNCAHDDSKVLETRRDGASVYRRRRCATCSHAFWTGETVIKEPPQRVREDRIAPLKRMVAMAANDPVAQAVAGPSPAAQLMMAGWVRK